MIRLTNSILNKRNIDGEIYLWDIKELFQFKVSREELYAAHARFNKMTKKQLAWELFKIQLPGRIKKFFMKVIRLRIKFHFEAT